MTEWIDVNEKLPPVKEGWNHSEMVLVYYPAAEGSLDGYGIGCYHRKPPHRNGPEWIDWAKGRDCQPSHWAAINKPGVTI